MFLKVMSEQDLADTDSRKPFQLFGDIKHCVFMRDEEGPRAIATFSDGLPVGVNIPGNAYLMNNHGKTVASFGSARLPEASE